MIPLFSPPKRNAEYPQQITEDGWIILEDLEDVAIFQLSDNQGQAAMNSALKRTGMPSNLINSLNNNPAVQMLDSSLLISWADGTEHVLSEMDGPEYGELKKQIYMQKAKTFQPYKIATGRPTTTKNELKKILWNSYPPNITGYFGEVEDLNDNPLSKYGSWDGFRQYSTDRLPTPERLWELWWQKTGQEDEWVELGKKKIAESQRAFESIKEAEEMLDYKKDSASDKQQQSIQPTVQRIMNLMTDEEFAEFRVALNSGDPSIMEMPMAAQIILRDKGAEICECLCFGAIEAHDDRSYGCWPCPGCNNDSDADIGGLCSTCTQSSKETETRLGAQGFTQKWTDATKSKSYFKRDGRNRGRMANPTMRLKPKSKWQNFRSIDNVVWDRWGKDLVAGHLFPNNQQGLNARPLTKAEAKTIAYNIRNRKAGGGVHLARVVEVKDGYLVFERPKKRLWNSSMRGGR